MDGQDLKNSPDLKRSPWHRGIRITVGLVIIAGIVFGVRLAMRGSQPAANNGEAATASVPVTAAVATQRDVPEIINAIGTVQSIDSVSVLPRVTGAIQKIEFTPGQDVEEGQELFLIDPRPYQAALDQAKAQLAHDQSVLDEAQMDLKRYQGLASKNAINAQQAEDQTFVVQQDKGTVQLDQANVEMAQLNLDYCHVKAPVAGRAGTLQVDLGNLVGPNGQAGDSATSSSGTQTTTSGTVSSSGPLVSIVQLKPIYVNFSVPQTELHQVIEGQAKAPLEVSVYSQAGKFLEKGKLTVINNQVSPDTGAAILQATFTNADHLLWPGEYVSVELVVGVRHNVVTVPASGVMVGPNGDYVYVIDADHRVKRVNVQQAARRAGVSVISKGIFAGQKVVKTGQYRLDNGTKVAVQTAQPQQTSRSDRDTGPITTEKPP